MKNLNKIQAIRHSEDVEDKHVRTFLRWLAVYILTVVAFTVVCIYEAFAQDINSLVPNTDISTEDVELITDDHIVPYIVEKPSMENLFVSPPPILVTFPLSEEMLNKLEVAWIKRALREGKDPYYYVDLARASEAKQREIVLSSARSAFEIYPNSNLFSQWSSNKEACGTCEINFYHCAEENGILKAEVIKLNNIIANSPKPCDNLGWGGPNVWKAKSDHRPGGVIVLDADYCDGSGGSLISNLRIEDFNGKDLGNTSYRMCNGDNGGRYHLDFQPEGKAFKGPLFVRYDFQGVEECRIVANPSQDYR
jgi:hypothetical protein